ncbi:hypothetical protein KUW18_09145 [Halomonas sp. DP5Y7-2]|uniref:hypothetical protein n=1 Tax=Halomonas sp. DP5Y7-2 TaxID=2859076 RepID=UPI001C998475|nr:hypothetical protein [Halomonas sp. DP5Y7-2]MBY5984256.1 hypothetical protein [Halomonas sp. DP5Y7-2]
MSSRWLFNIGSVLAVLAFFILDVESFFSLKGGLFFATVSIFFMLGTLWDYRQLSDGRKQKMRLFFIWGFRGALIAGGFFSYLDSRELVVLSLGLPADDFPSTMSALFGVHYLVYSPLMFFGALSLICGIVSIPLVFYSLFGSLFYSMLPSFFKRSKGDISPFVGGYVTVLVLFSVTAFASVNIGELFSWREGVVKEMAYNLDYTIHDNVPCIERNKKSVIHPGGFVSYADQDGDGAVIIIAEPLSNSCEI